MSFFLLEIILSMFKFLIRLEMTGFKKSYTKNVAKFTNGKFAT